MLEELLTPEERVSDVVAHLAKNEEAGKLLTEILVRHVPDMLMSADWWRRFHVFTGEHWILTPEGWEPGANKADMVRFCEAEGMDITDYIEDEVNAPPEPAMAPS